MTENNDNTIISKGYKEIDILYGSDVKNNNNIEFRYTEPKKLQEIEKFIIESLISIRTNCDIFHDVNHELKYFDYSIITSINEILISHRENNNNSIENLNPNINGIDSLINKINNKLYDNYLTIKNFNSERIITEDLKTITLNVRELGSDNFSNLLLIKKENILQELFEEGDLMRSMSVYRENSGIIKTSENLIWNSQNFSKMNEIVTNNNDQNEIVNNSNNDQNENVSNYEEDERPVSVKYVEADDGWAMRTKADGFGFGLKNLNHEEIPKVQNKKVQNKIQKTKNIVNVTLNLSKIEKDMDVGKDVSVVFSQKISNISCDEETNDIYFTNNQRAFLNNEENNENNYQNESQTIDNLMKVFDDKNYKTRFTKIFTTEEDHKINKISTSDHELIQHEIPKHNVFSSLMKKTNSIGARGSVKLNQSHNEKIHFNLNLNIPLQNIKGRTPLNSNGKNYFKKETIIPVHNKLTLIDAGVDEINKNLQMIKLPKKVIPLSDQKIINNTLENLKVIFKNNNVNLQSMNEYEELSKREEKEFAME